MQTQTIRLSSNGHIVIPKAILDAYHFNIGQELEIETTSQGILLKAKNSPSKTTLNDLIGCTGYQGKAKTLEEMDEGIRQGIIAEWGQK
jgi:bifunctional DNA-binding transcriptional regulator/antitoxin component of YhaV-PrlF toxin-antitoxin module